MLRSMILGLVLFLDSGWAFPAQSIPRDLREVWLRFHEGELCQGVDAVFQFHHKGMEVWCLVEDEKAYQRFTEMIEPLRPKYTVDLYVTRPAAEKKSPEDRDPPPSLWNNAEIRAYLQDPFQRNNPGPGLTVRPPPGSEPDAELFLKQRILMFAEQTLEWDNKMKKYAADLPALAEAGFNRSADPELKTQTVAVCLAHAQALDKHAERLIDNLTRALPKSDRRFRSPELPDKGRRSGPPDESAQQVSNAARSIARRIYRFIHPQQHTVGLVDLREPSLLESLKTLRRMVADFQRAARSGSGQ